MRNMPNLPTNIVDFRGFYSSTILNLRGGIPRPIGDFPESLTQAMSVGIMLVGRLGVQQHIIQRNGGATEPVGLRAGPAGRGGAGR